MSTTDWARIATRGSRLRRYYNPNLDPEYVARTSGVYGTTAYSNPLVVISPTPTPGSHEPVTPTAPAVPDIAFILSLSSAGHVHDVLTVEQSGGRTEVLAVRIE
jgi:hypothetical protein